VHLEDDRLYVLLDRYLAGEASAADEEAVREWLADDAEHAVLLADLQLIRRVTTEQVPHSSADAAWAKAARRVSRRRRFSLTTLAAAAVVLALIGGWTVLRRTPPWKEYATAAGQRTVIRLRDGTQVTLAPKSRVRYATDYGRAHRDLYLEGQAYFQVAPDSQRPLRVHTAHSVTEDLATAFVVTAYADQRATEVVVAEGRVALWRIRGEVPEPGVRPALVLEARDLGRLDPNGVATLRRRVDVSRQLSWTTGALGFDGAPLNDVVPALERWYNVEIRLADSALGARRLTATFTNEPVDLVLQRIGLTLGLRVERAPGGARFSLLNGR
jgi:ferric-dicitrate binding protein FerR (iron transport regulator)